MPHGAYARKLAGHLTLRALEEEPIGEHSDMHWPKLDQSSREDAQLFAVRYTYGVRA